MSNKKKIMTARKRALERQQGRCCYCGCQLWLGDPLPFARRYGLTLAAAKCLQATAEHWIARCDGGTDASGNIAAACILCNWRRHARPRPLDTARYHVLVTHRMARGRWHSPVIHKSGVAAHGTR